MHVRVCKMQVQKTKKDTKVGVSTDGPAQGRTISERGEVRWGIFEFLLMYISCPDGWWQ